MLSLNRALFPSEGTPEDPVCGLGALTGPPKTLCALCRPAPSARAPRHKNPTLFGRVEKPSDRARAREKESSWAGPAWLRYGHDPVPLGSAALRGCAPQKANAGPGLGKRGLLWDRSCSRLTLRRRKHRGRTRAEWLEPKVGKTPPSEWVLARKGPGTHPTTTRIFVRTEAAAVLSPEPLYPCEGRGAAGAADFFPPPTPDGSWPRKLWGRLCSILHGLWFGPGRPD